MKKRRSWKKAVVIGIALAMGVMPQAFAATLTINGESITSTDSDAESWIHEGVDADTGVDYTDVYYGPGNFTDEPDDEATYEGSNTINVTGNTNTDSAAYNFYGSYINDTHSNITHDNGTGDTDSAAITSEENYISITGGSAASVYGAYGQISDTAVTLTDDAEVLNFDIVANNNEISITGNSTITGDVYGSYAHVYTGALTVTFTDAGATLEDDIDFVAVAGGSIQLVGRDGNDLGDLVGDGLGNSITIEGSTIGGRIFGGYALADAGTITISPAAGGGNEYAWINLASVASHNEIKVTDSTVTGAIYGGYAESNVTDFTGGGGGTAGGGLRDNVNLIADASNNTVTVTNSSVGGNIYGGVADIRWRGDEEYFGESEFHTSYNTVNLDGVEFTGEGQSVYGGYLFVSNYETELEGELQVSSTVSGNTINITGKTGGTDLTGVNLYGAYPDYSDLTPTSITNNTLSLSGSWLDATAAASSDEKTAAIGGIHFFDSIKLDDLNFTMTLDGTGDKTISAAADGMGGLAFTYSNPNEGGETSATSIPLAIAATAASVTFSAADQDAAVYTAVSSNIALDFTSFAHNSITSRETVYTSTGVTYSFNTEAITNTTYDYAEQLTDGSSQTGVRAHVMTLTADNTGADADSHVTGTYGSLTATVTDGEGGDVVQGTTTGVDPYDSPDGRTYTYTLNGSITDSILTGIYTSDTYADGLGTGALVLGGDGVASTKAEIIAGSYSSTGAATGGTVTISDGFSAGDGRVDRNQTETDTTINIFAGYSAATGGSVSNNTVTLNGTELDNFNFYGYNAEDLSLYDGSAGTSGGDNVLNISAAGETIVNNIGYFDTYSFDVSAAARADGTYQSLTVNNFYSGDGSDLYMKIDTESNTSDYVYVQGTHTGTSAITLSANGQDLTDAVIGTILVSVKNESGSFTAGNAVYEGALVWQTYSLKSATEAVELANGKTLAYDDKGTDWYIEGVSTVDEQEPGPDEDNPDDDGDEGDKDTEPGPAEPPDDGDGDGGPGPAQPTGNTTTVNTVIASNAVNYYAFRETDKLLRRMGELRNNGEDEQGIWIRVKGAKTGRDSSFENKYTHYELGYDTLVKNDHREKRYEGVSLSYMDGSVKYSGISGSGKAHDEEIAFYRVDQYKHGHYLDLVTRIGMYSNRFGVYDTNQNKIHGKNDTYGISTSAEYGRKKDYAHGWYIEPQGQLTIGYLSGNDYTTSNKVDVSNGCISSLVGRVGANFGKNFGKEKKGIVYLKANWLHEFLGSYSIDMVSNAGNRVHAHGDYRDNWFEYGLGVAYKYTKNNFVYADIERTAGSDYYKNWAWNVGLRWTFN